MYDPDPDNIHNVLELSENKQKFDKIKERFMDNSDDLIEKMYSESETRVFIIQDYMSKDLSERIKKSFDNAKTKTKLKLKMCFLSDIRTSLFRAGSPTDLDIIWNYALQIIFIKILQPKYSMTKFRPPWYTDTDTYGQQITKIFKMYMDGIDDQMIKQEISKIQGFEPGVDIDLNLGSDIFGMFEMVKMNFDYVKKNYDVDLFAGMLVKKTYYFANDFIYTQAWSPQSSGETRVFVSKKNMNKFINYDNNEWDDKFFYIRYIRLYAYFDIFHKLIKNNHQSDYDGCYDCYRELMILGNHILWKKQGKMKFDGVMDVENFQNVIEDNIHELLELYNLINKYVYYGIKSSKCPSHNTQKTNYLLVDFYGNGYAYNVKINDQTEYIEKHNVLKKNPYDHGDGFGSE